MTERSIVADTKVAEGTDSRNGGIPGEVRERHRTFLHEISGEYSAIYKRIFSYPRVYPSNEVAWTGGPQHWHKSVIDPGRVDVTQMFHCHLDIYAPGARTQRHAHMNSAVFYILAGSGHDVHDGRRIDWKAGDAVIVEPGCVHQHFNDSDTEFARVLVIKAKPAFIFANLIYQKLVTPGPKGPLPGYETVDISEIDPYSRDSNLKSSESQDRK